MNDPTVCKEKHNAEDTHFGQLLMAWKLPHLLSHLRRECIDLDVLQMIKLPHIPHILKGFPYGDQIRFEYHLEQWRQTNGCPLTGAYVGTPDRTEPTINNRNVQNDSRSKSFTPQIVSTFSTATQTSSTVKTSSEANENMHIGKYPYLRLHLHQILESTDRGNQIISFYARYGRLKPRQRVILMSLIAKYFYEHEIHLNIKMAQIMEREILELFPTEELKDYYINGHSRIYKRYANVKHYNNRRQKAKHGNSEQERMSTNPDMGNDDSILEISDDEMSCSRESNDADDRDLMLESKPIVVMEPVWDNNAADEFKPDVVSEISDQKKYQQHSTQDREHIVAAFMSGDDWAALARVLGVNYKTAWGWVNRSQSKALPKDKEDNCLEKILE